MIGENISDRHTGVSVKSERPGGPLSSRVYSMPSTLRSAKWENDAIRSHEDLGHLFCKVRHLGFIDFSKIRETRPNWFKNNVNIKEHRKSFYILS